MPLSNRPSGRSRSSSIAGLSAVVALALVAVGCSSSSSSGASTTSSTSATVAVATAGQFCTLAKAAQDAGLAVDTKATDQATLEPEVNAALAATKAAAAVAPADYADIATATVTQEEAVIALLQKYGWNFATALASDDGNAFFTSPDYSAVTAKRDAYLQQHCDLAPATAGTSGADVVLSPGDAGIRQLFQLLQIGGQLDITDDQIDCLVTELSGKITDADLDAIGKGKTVTDAGTAAFVAALSTCGAVPTA